jgi:hypothetical protein
MHQAAISDRSEQERNCQIKTENARTQTAGRLNYSMTRAKSNIFKDPAVFPERDLSLGSPIEVIEN